MTRNGILFVDDEAKALKYFAKAFADQFTVFSATSAAEALCVLEAHHREIGVIVTDQRMPEASGVDLLKIVRRQYPRTVRILTTAYSELDLLIEAINTGAVYSFVTKPWQLEDLERTLLGAFEHHEKERREHELLEQKLDEFQAEILEGHTYDIALIAAKIGHYVHNALCPVTLLIDELLKKDGTSQVPREFLEGVGTHIQEVARMLKDLAHVSEPPPRSRFKPMDVVEALDQSLSHAEVFRAEKEIRIDKEVIGHIPPIIGVPSEIEKLFRFMISEEIVSLPARSRVSLRLEPHIVDGEVLGVKIEFEDFAPVRAGVQPENLLHPFNLRGTNPREFGIFLASSYFITNHHDGSLTVRIKEDKSLVFSFFLPCEQAGNVVKKSARMGDIHKLRGSL
jgi:FixJ family two-component response regulator